VRFAEAGILGGGVWHVCGAAAIKLCNSRPTAAPAFRHQCTDLEEGP
jgi:hypothetical protein